MIQTFKELRNMDNFKINQEYNEQNFDECLDLARADEQAKIFKDFDKLFVEAEGKVWSAVILYQGYELLKKKYLQKTLDKNKK